MDSRSGRKAADLVSPPGQVLYKLAWSESMERDCATFCAKK